MDKPRRTLITGASGLLGQALLAQRPLQPVIALAHRTLVDGPGIETINGDIRKRQLGLNDLTYNKLVCGIETIIHSAAITHFGVAPEKIIGTNVDGTREIVKLARAAEARLIYVSTAFVQDTASAVAPPSVYESSKRSAEVIVGSLGPAAIIVRPSIIIGDSRTGAVARHQGLHHIVGSMAERSLPVLPATPGMFCDFIAQDWVANAIWAVAAHPAPAPEVWVTAGESAMTVEAIVELAVEIGNEFGFTGAPPRVVPFETLQRLFIPVFLGSLPQNLARRFAADLKLARYMNQVTPLPSSEAYLRTELGLAARIAPDEVLRCNMRRWAQGRLANRRQTVCAVRCVRTHTAAD